MDFFKNAFQNFSARLSEEFLSVKTLHVKNLTVINSEIEVFTKLSGIESLHINRVDDFTEVSLETMFKELNQLKSLEITGTAEMLNQTLNHVGNFCKKIKVKPRIRIMGKVSKKLNLFFPGHQIKSTPIIFFHPNYNRYF